MAIRNIVKDKDPVLRKKSRVVEKVDERIQTLIDDMADTMYNADGVGLAAPQVGILKRIIVIDVGEGLIELINPEIVEKKGEQIDAEGCLSVPGVTGDVKRPKWVKVKGLDRNGNPVEMEGKDLLARAFCHEIDHLEGILFIDKVIK
ncbi:peptide deformylase [Crassaminicella indica]|uniref:Peptide deformylase n=1 Tax=Crassaminicella indica TaxID=2855394 RepID=A0ABX8RAN8_9CLOT|nr:peptide deformylase [Crassaminicella indica]QXM05861.1 peptide deformylase [Crassaminicella indica]